MMNFSTIAQSDSHTRKENIPPSIKTTVQPVQRTKQRTVLGVLSENEQRGRSHSQGSQFSKHSSISDSFQLTYHGCCSSSSFDVYVEKTREVFLSPSGPEGVSYGCNLDAESAAFPNEGVGLLLELSSSSPLEVSMQSVSDKCLTLEDRLFVSQYAEDIHQNLRESESRFRPKPDYLDRHPEITNGMRVSLVDWLEEVVMEFQIRSETLHLAVNYMDRFLSCTLNVRKRKLQLVGTAALMIAAKYEEVSPPEMGEFLYATDSTYSKKQLIRMEHIFLGVLNFEMAAPTINQFLELFMFVQPVCPTAENLARYVAELSLLEVDPFLQFSPSLVATAAYCLAVYTISRSLWPDSLRAFTGYMMAEILPCLKELHKLHTSVDSRPYQAIREKYRSSKYCCVSLITPPAVLPLPLLHPSSDASA